MALMAEERRRKMSSERGERACVEGDVAGGEGERRGFARNDQNAPPTLFRLFSVQAKSFLLPLI